MTSLLTRCHSASSLFSAVFSFRKVVLEIFSELDTANTKVPIFPTSTQSPKGANGLGSPCLRGERGRVLTDAPCRGEAEVGVVVVTGVVLPRRLLVGGGSAGGGAPVDVALVHEGRTWPCQKCAQQDEEKEGIEKRARGCVSSPESEETRQ